MIKGILKIYHPEETLKYHIHRSYCKAVYLNNEHHLELEFETDENLDHVEDDSLQYQFPQLAMTISDFPLENGQLSGKTLSIEDSDDTDYTYVNLFDDEEAYLYNNELAFSMDQDGDLQVIWKGEIDDFYTSSETSLPFKLKCHFKKEVIDIDEE